ncbi:MAG: RagB/SusD family nutrient uptake outer membrane protein [Mediterranea sp.]|nr:RagB/SusD family nutrient uptake outer membrane protein [Mediterranea sp.]
MKQNAILIGMICALLCGSCSGFLEESDLRFLRALTYFHLVMQWGDVPVVTTELKTKEDIRAHTRRDPKGDVYHFIEEDLQAVIASELHGDVFDKNKQNSCPEILLTSPDYRLSHLTKGLFFSFSSARMKLL